MSLVGNFTKAPQERADYAIDLVDALDGGETITNVVWHSSVPYELVIGDGQNGLSQPAVQGSKIRVWLGGGVPGRFYTVNADIATSAGRVLARGFGMQVADDRALPGASQLARSGVGGGSALGSLGTNDIVMFVGTVGLSALVIAPGLWFVGKAFKVPIKGWALAGAALTASLAVTLSMYFLKRGDTQTLRG